MLEKKKNTELAKESPKDLLKFNTTPNNFKHVKTVSLAVNDKSDSLAKIRKKAGKKVSLSIIKVWLINLNDFLNISRKMNQVQIEETADLLYDEFYYLKISDIALLMKRIKTGHYGQFYESIDGMKLMEMFYQYAQERVNGILDNSEREERELKYKYNEDNQRKRLNKK
jgi:hypothetical protein